MFEDIESLKKNLQEYVEIKLDLIRLHTAENLSKIFSTAASLAVIGYLLFFIFLFLSMAAGFYISTRLDSNELGFLSVALFYVFVLIAFIILKKHFIERPIIKAMIQLFFPTFTDHEKKS